MLEALRIRDFRLLWSARLTSSLGTWLLVIAAPAYVYQLTGSYTATGLTMVAEYLPVLLFGPIAGVLADRWDRRLTMVAVDLFRCGAIALLFLVRSPETVWLVYVALAAESTGAVLFRPAAQAHVPAVVGTGSALSSVHALNAVTDATMRLVGAPLGAALMVWWGFHPVVAIPVVAYLVSAGVLALMSGGHRRPDGSRTTVQRVLADLRGGLGALRAERRVRALLPVLVVFLAGNASLSALLVPHGVSQWGGERQVGLVVSALGVGFLLGAPLIRLLVDRVRPRHLLSGGLAVIALGFYALFSAGTVLLAMAAAVAVGVAGSIVTATPQITVQRVIPNELLGRVSAVFFSAEALAALTGALAGPALAEAFDVRAAMYVACAGTAVTALCCLLTLPGDAGPAADRAGAGAGAGGTEPVEDVAGAPPAQAGSAGPGDEVGNDTLR